MKRGKDYIAFPLDVPTVAAAQQYVRQLSGHVGMFKVGLELFIESGRRVIDFIHEQGDTAIFLDLKLHDIPATVERAMRRIAALGVNFTTVHCGETPRMLEAAVAGAGGSVGVLGVTVLTSVAAGDIRAAGFREQWCDLPQLVSKRAAMAQSVGCAGIVCSGLEVARLKAQLRPGFLAVTPGIRPAWQDSGGDDQRRIATPAKAVRDGADYLVIGRPIRDAADPQEAADLVAKEVEAVL